MSFQKNDESDFDFSVIDKRTSQQAKLNFSVQSLLSQHHKQQHESVKQRLNKQDDEQACNIYKQNQVQKQQVIDGSFLQDLQKLEQQLSFQTRLYDVYQQGIDLNGSQVHTKSYLHAKSNSHLKTTKQQTQDPTKSLNYDDYGYLVLDFGKSKKCKPNNIGKTKSKTNLPFKLKTLVCHDTTQNNHQSRSKSKKSLAKLLSPGSGVKSQTLRSPSKSKTPFLGIRGSRTSITSSNLRTPKSSTKSLRDNICNQYYGNQQFGLSERLAPRRQVKKQNKVSKSKTKSKTKDKTLFKKVKA